MIITQKLIEELRTKRGYWTKHCFERLGVAYPPLGKWRERIVGNEIPDITDGEFQDLRSTMKDVREEVYAVEEPNAPIGASTAAVDLSNLASLLLSQIENYEFQIIIKVNKRNEK